MIAGPQNPTLLDRKPRLSHLSNVTTHLSPSPKQCPWSGDGAPVYPGHGDLRLADCDEDCCCRLEVYHDGSWGTVCEHYFNENAGRIACRQMGLPSTNVQIRTGFIGGVSPGSGPIWLDNVNCGTANPARLEDCPHR